MTARTCDKCGKPATLEGWAFPGGGSFPITGCGDCVQQLSDAGVDVMVKAIPAGDTPTHDDNGVPILNVHAADPLAEARRYADDVAAWAASTEPHPEYPCTTPNCPGDGRYAPPGRGHAAYCTHPLAPDEQ